MVKAKIVSHQRLRNLTFRIMIFKQQIKHTRNHTCYLHNN